MKKILWCFIFLSSLAVQGQGVLDVRLDGSEKGKSLSVFLRETEKEKGAHFYFLQSWVESLSFERSYSGQTLAEAIDDLIAGSGLSYTSMYPNIVVFLKDPTGAILREQALALARRDNKKIGRYQFGQAGAPKRGLLRITGIVTDARTSEPLTHADIHVSDALYGATTDDGGKYALTIPPGSYVLDVSFVDYEDQVIDLEAYADGEIDIALEDLPTLLGEVVIQDPHVQDMATARIGQTEFVMRDLQRAPAMLGEPDVIRQVQTLPGVTTVGESASGFNVRGGSVDQNLVLYDGLPVFNSSHVFGFLSSFNSQAIRDVSFYRGGIPSEFGGRASSVLDIHAKDGDFRKWNVDAGVGMITSNVTVDGPLRKDKTSLAASFRSTYSNWLIHSVRTDYADLSNSSVFFYDGTVKVTHALSDNTRLSFTGYSSRDEFRLVGDSTYQWNNFLVSAALDHEFSPKLGCSIVAGSSAYGYNVANNVYSTASELSYRLSAAALKAGFAYEKGSHKVRLGWQQLFYHFDPGSLKPTSSESNARRVSLDKQNSIEDAVFLSDEWSPRENVFIEAGLRVPMFVAFGPAWVNIYNGPPETANVADSLHFGWNKPVKTYAGFEPRLSIRRMTGADASVKLGYNRIHQFLHLVTNTAAVTPVDIWQPSGYYFKPQHVDEVSLGYFHDMQGKKYGFSVEGFYKIFRNILDFKDGARLILNPHLETALLQGRGRSYGVETSFNKKIGRLTGSVNYTWSRAFRLIAGPSTRESVNDGEEYPANFDQPHILNLAWKYNVSRRFYFTGDFTYHSGRPITIPLSAFSVEHTTVAYFSGRNQYRIPDYHRLDLALVIEGSNRRSKKVESNWVISLYNVYARKNPYTIFFESSGAGIPRPFQLSIIGTVLPSISYNLKFL